MTVPTVLQIEYLGDMAPYDYEIGELKKIDTELRVVRGTDADRLVADAVDCDVLWLEWTPHLTAPVLQQLPRCGLVMRWGVGYDQIDVDAASELGIAVANAPTFCTQDVAEHAIALLLSVSRQVVARHEQMRAGLWRAGRADLRRVDGSTVGVIGLGRIGRRVAAIAAAMGAQVLGYDVLGYDGLTPAPPGVEVVGLDELLARSDFVSVHVPMSTANYHLFNDNSIGAMKPGAVLVNTSRGNIVEQDALVRALESGQLSGAALDVFEIEPLPADSVLRAVPNLVLTSHEGANSAASHRDLRREMCTATAEWLTTGWTSSIVNPQIRGRERGPHVG
jgi:D-3-phosphoglycerate dehydrogenase